jgi:hypothetical protein
MCVILAKNAEAEVPYDHIWSAANTNQHGFGLAIADRGKLIVNRYFSIEGNDPDKIARLMEEAKGLPALAHFRFRTQGEKNIDNCQPFHLLTNKKHDTDIVFAHNGTLPEFSNSSNSASDSALFAQSVVLPLLERSLAIGVEPEELLADSVVSTILRQFAGNASKFSLMDGNGKWLIINVQQGVSQPYGWASNSYSLNKTRTPPPSERHFSGGKSGIHTPSSGTVVIGDFKQSEKLVLTAGATAIKQHILKAQHGNADPLEWPPIKDRATFCELAGLHSIEDLQYLTPTEILEMCKEYPYMAALAIMDAIVELQDAIDG